MITYKRICADCCNEFETRVREQITCRFCDAQPFKPLEAKPTDDYPQAAVTR